MTDNERTLNVQDSVLNLLAQVPEVVKLGLAQPTDDNVRTYEVSVSNLFDATSYEDAMRQMVAWLQDHAANAGYRVIRDDDESEFIDGESIDWNELGLE